MAARASLKTCILAAIENFHHNKFPSLAIVHHPRGKYYSLLQPSEFNNLPAVQDPDESYIVFLGTQKELHTFFSLKENQTNIFNVETDGSDSPP